MLVVGVGHRGSTIRDTHHQRQRDFTSDGAERFLAFIRDELKPWVGDRYPADPDDSAFYGASLGGLFATHVLLKEPSTFRRYGIGSPAYWWDDGVMFAKEAEYAKSHSDLTARVFVSVGGDENPQGARRQMERLPPDRRAKAEAEEAADPTPDTVG